MSTQIKVELNAEEIQAQVIQSILDSSIGKALKTNLEKLAEQWKVNSYWDDNLKKIIESEVMNQVRVSVTERIKPIIVAKVAELVTDDLVYKITQAGFSRLVIRDY